MVSKPSDFEDLKNVLNSQADYSCNTFYLLSCTNPAVMDARI